MALRRVNNNGAWSPSEAELRVAEYLACGYSQNRTAQLCDMNQSTISYWMKREEFAQLVADRTAQFLNSGDAVFAQTVALARLIVHQAMTGERSRDDPTVELAFSYLHETDFPRRRGEVHKQFGS
jgi:hypothetical protein